MPHRERTPGKFWTGAQTGREKGQVRGGPGMFSDRGEGERGELGSSSCKDTAPVSGSCPRLWSANTFPTPHFLPPCAAKG